MCACMLCAYVSLCVFSTHTEKRVTWLGTRSKAEFIISQKRMLHGSISLLLLIPSSQSASPRR